MNVNQKRIIEILNNARRNCRRQDDCNSCPYVEHGADCLHAMMADYLVKAGITIPSHCSNCTNPHGDCDICNIRKSPFAAKLNLNTDCCEFCAIGGCKK